MSLLKVDVNELNKLSNEIMEVSYKYNELVTKYYQRINGINNKTMEWVGSDADGFIATINKEKIIYDNIGKALKSYSLELDKYSKKIERLVKLNSVL